MKILFITPASGLDYMADCVFHGLVRTGCDVTDSKYLWYLSQPLPYERKRRLYGRGMTISGNLEDRSQIDRSNIRNRILSREFDAIIYGSAWRCSDYISTVAQSYPREKVLIIDGEDHAAINKNMTPYGLMFKRERANTDSRTLPIQFGIPQEKLCSCAPCKKRVVAKMVPGAVGQKNYLYELEQEYYAGYQESLFGITCKKAGWDCMRHYEIIANRCLPYFKDYESCPAGTMCKWPWKLQAAANALYERAVGRGSPILSDSGFMKEYFEVESRFFEYCSARLTTKALAADVLSALAL